MRFELMTSSLPRRRSTPELRGRKPLAPCRGRRLGSGRRGSNSRPSAWKADALPTELLPPGEMMNDECRMMNKEQFVFQFIIHHSAFIVSLVQGVGFEPT